MSNMESSLVCHAHPLAIGQLPSASQIAHVSQKTEDAPLFQLANISCRRPATSVLDSGPTFTNHQHKDSDITCIGAAFPIIFYFLFFT